jgi:acetyl/propionyl-CoA carboxylase alpha subunit
MIGSLLIANRGEIACRIIRTARRLGVGTVAVYSDADAEAPHVRLADQAVALGGATAKESYLVGDRIIAAARASGAEAIHPGYGFLSENADFAEAVQAAGLVWVGPPASSIRAMGLKDAAKALMQDAGVPVTPGYLGEDQSAGRLKAEADRIGYPILIKAVAGGGGKGMRKVERSEDFADALISCRREAAASFGDDRVLLETYVQRPRHIEVQVFADDHGDVVHLFERDCSLQRRHQKVIEEAPAPGMTEEVREAVCGAAVKAARAVGYRGAGTIEFIADGSAGLRADRIWFMEMNTRLQVEHPVTELITGQDLVEWQLRVASGEPLPLTQEQLRSDGWAMEARLYAEDPISGFLPSIGPLKRFRMPDGVRVDSGVEEGGDVTPLYDPMVAKLIVHAPSRESAASRLAQASREVQVWPVKTNAAFLGRALADADFLAGRVDTAFIGDRLDGLIPAEAPGPAALQAAARAQLAFERPRGRAFPVDPPGFRLNGLAETEVRLSIGGREHLVLVDAEAPVAEVVRIGDDHLVFDAGQAFVFSRPRAIAGDGGGEGGGAVVSPMPGRIVSVEVMLGQPVTKGQALLTLEAMKMEHTLTAGIDGIVLELNAAAGAQVSEGMLLVKLGEAH